MSHYRADTGEGDEGFADVQRELESELKALFATAEGELKRLDEAARQAAPLRSLLNHREGLSVFADTPRVPMDNNLAERTLRGAVIGRRLSFGSDSAAGASAGRRRFGKRTCRKSSTTPASSSCPGSKSPTSPPTSCPWSAAN